MMHHHSRSRVTHNDLHFFLHIWAITVNQAFSASTLLFLKRALVQAHLSIFKELNTLEAEFTVGAMVRFAVNVNHGIDCFLFPSNPFVLKSGLLA